MISKQEQKIRLENYNLELEKNHKKLKTEK